MKRLLYLTLASFLVVTMGISTAEAQTQQEVDFLDSIFEQYDDLMREQENLIDSSQNSTNQEYLDSLNDQINKAEEAVSGQESSAVGLQLTPQNPHANSEVTVSLSGYGLNLEEARISWSVDGREVRSGTGVTSVQIRTGDIGDPTVVTAQVQPLETAAFTRTTTITPNEIDLLWEAIDSQTPPFYRGKALPSYDSIVKVTTIANIYDTSGVRVNPQDIVYTWEQNGRKRDLSEYSGYGKSTAYAYGDFLTKSHIVSVDLSNTRRGINAKKATVFALRDPEIVFYEKEPLGGINFERALRSRGEIEAGNSIRLVAMPYFFDSRDNFLDLDFEWSVNGNQVNNTSEMNFGEIPLTTQSQGLSRLRLEIDSDKMLQNAEAEFGLTVR